MTLRPLTMFVAAATLLFASAHAQSTVRIICGSVGDQTELCRQQAEMWAAETGNRVEVLASVPGSDDRLAIYQQQLTAGSSEIDVYQIENIWPALLADFFADLNEYLPAGYTDEFFPGMIQNDTVDGRLISVPWYGDAGLLYYRTDLLEAYGFDGPPATWTELEQMAAEIQAGQRAAGNASFWGFVWQGAPYEGLTCDALEWIYSFDGGTIVAPDGTITVNNEAAAAALDMAAAWVGTISPPGVTGYREEDSRGIWQAGNSAFMRNWPYAYALGNSDDSPIRGLFDVTVLPAGPTGMNAATFGGHSLAVSRFSNNAEAAADLVRFLTSYDVQADRAKRGYNPSRPAVYEDEAVLDVVPFMGALFPVFANAVQRPTTVTAEAYPRVSQAFWSASHAVLTGQSDGATALAQLERQLEQIRGRDW